MSPEEAIVLYAQNNNLTGQDVTYLTSLLAQARKEERESCAVIVEHSRSLKTGGSSSFGDVADHVAKRIRNQ